MRTNLRNVGLMIAIMAIVGFMWVSTPYAAESLIQGTIDSATVSMSKQQKEYVRLIVNQAKESNGIKYNTQAVVMVFDDNLVKTAKLYKKGDNLKAVCSSKEYNGRTSYQMLAAGGMKPVAAK